MLHPGQLSAAFLLVAAQFASPPPGSGPGEPPGYRRDEGRPDMRREPGGPPGLRNGVMRQGPGFFFGRPPPFGQERRGACLSSPETREAVQSRQAVPPPRAVAEAMREGGDLVMIRLCRFPDEPLTYDVAVLRRDGRLVHVFVNAESGAAMPPPRRGP